MVFKTKRVFNQGESGCWRDYSLWSVVMITDCAASGTEPSLAAASATISNAALIGRPGEVKGLGSTSYSANLPFRTDHEDTRQREFHKLDAGARVEQGGTQLYAAPCAVACMGRRTDGIYDKEEKCKGERERKRDWRARDSEAGVVHEVYVERDVDGRDEYEHVCGCIHDSFDHFASVFSAAFFFGETAGPHWYAP